jgi:hypothetical protein
MAGCPAARIRSTGFVTTPCMFSRISLTINLLQAEQFKFKAMPKSQFSVNGLGYTIVLDIKGIAFVLGFSGA